MKKEVSKKESDEMDSENGRIPIAIHHDADGISSAVLLMKSMDKKQSDFETFFPDVFGSFLDKNSYMVDMTPREGFEGVCYDHHDQHPDKIDYKLIFGHKPTSALVFEDRFKYLPSNEWWKMAVGCVGDYSVESIPPKVWDSSPSLRDVHTTVWEEWGELNVQISHYTVYKLIASPINAACRVGKEHIALDKLFNANRPTDLLYDEELNSYKVKVQKEVKRVIKDSGKSDNPRLIFPGAGDIGLISFRSKLRISGIVSSKIHEVFSGNDAKTIIAINETRGNGGKGSIRGNMTGYIASKLSEAGFATGGHGVAAGFDMNALPMSYLIDVVRKI